MHTHASPAHTSGSFEGSSGTYKVDMYMQVTHICWHLRQQVIIVVLIL